MMALRGSGDSMTPLWFMIVAVVLDSGLNPFFIRGFGPVPPMGIAGSAMSTLVGNYVSLLGLLGFLYLRDLPLRLRGHELSYLLPDPAILKTLVLKGLPMGIQRIVISVSAMALIGLVNREGIDTAAAENLAWLVHEKGIEPHIPVFEKSTREDGIFSRSDFTFDHQRDVYICPGCKELKRYHRSFATPRNSVGADGMM